MLVIKSSKSFPVLLPTPPRVEVLKVNVGFTSPTVNYLAYIPLYESADYWEKFLESLIAFLVT